MPQAKLLLSSMLLATAASAAGISAAIPDPVTAPSPPTVVSPAEYDRTIDAMKPPKRARPVIAVLGDNRGAEAIDFLVPYGVLKQSGAADVFAVGMTADRLQLRPALAIKPHMTIKELDSRYPNGADYVVVPAMVDHETPEVIAWIRSQAAKGGATGAGSAPPITAIICRKPDSSVASISVVSSLVPMPGLHDLD